MQVGEIYEIKKSAPGGYPLIRIESVGTEVRVSDWFTPKRPVLNGNRTFSYGLADAKKTLKKYWRKLRSDRCDTNNP